MKQKNWLYWLLIIISIITVISGVSQMIMPGFVLNIVGGEPSPTSLQFFSIIGMFMLFFGGMLLQGLWDRNNQPILVLWSGFQKIGACIAVTVGVVKGLFGWTALLVAGFDLFSGFLILFYWLSIKS